ncbi:MAG: M6 family metalloprotease domain-containing protein [Candidatus Muirbacterium halophilum]|nr:M6 family metalloprotease domain-containing protein [Candidatus Muirbacterium halophilum]MCK9474485.1 M6 family metalloprotease domain-containing protein [Candidatus Muirbacterium halophilum]
MKRILLIFILIISSFSALSMPPIPGNNNYKDYPDYKVLNKNAKYAPGINRAQQVIGNKSILVIKVRFTDEAMVTSDPAIVSLFDNVKTFYSENSRNLTNLNFTFTTIYALPNTYAYYGADSGGIDTNVANYFITAALSNADPDVNFNSYDHVVILHAGSGQESDSAGTNSHLIWSAVYSGINYNTDDGIVLQSVAIVPETELSGYSSFGVICHELGHELGKLPDLYSTNNSNDGIGIWGLMGNAGWLGNGNTPGHFCAWSKVQMGWVNPIVKSSNETNINIYDDASTKTVIKVEKSPGSQEYFLIENRYRNSGYDSQLPGKGILIWHVDDSQSNNNNTSRRLVALEEADGGNDLDVYNGTGSQNTDVYPIGNNVFSDTSNPNSKWYDNSSSNLRVYDITASSSTALLSIQLSTIQAPVISSVTTEDSGYIQKTEFNIGETVYIKALLTSGESINTKTVSITGPNSYSSGDIVLTTVSPLEYNTSWSSVGKETGTYSYTVTIANTGGNDTRTSSFTIVDPTPSVVTLLSPDDNADIGTKFPTFRWQGLMSQPDVYILQIDTREDFNSTFAKTLNGDQTEYTLEVSDVALVVDTLYYWRVFGIKGGFSSVEGAVKRTFTVVIDEAGPEVSQVFPTADSQDNPIDTTVLVTFNESIDQASITANSIYLSVGGNKVNTSLVYDENSKTVSITGNNPFIYDSEYTLTVIGGETNPDSLTDISGNKMAATFNSKFNTVKYPSLQNFNVSDKPGDAGGFFIVNFDIPQNPVDVTAYIETVKFYYLKKETEFLQTDIAAATLITKTMIELAGNTEFEIEITDSIDYFYAFGIEYITKSGKTSKLATLSGKKSYNDANIVQYVNYEIQPNATVSGVATEYTLWLQPVYSDSSHTGFDKILIDVSDFANIDSSQSIFSIEGNEYTRSANPTAQEFDVIVNGNTVEVVIGNLITNEIANNKVIIFNFKATTAGNSGEEKQFNMVLENTVYNKILSETDIFTSNVDGNSGNGDGNTIIIKNTVSSVIAEVIPDRFGIESTAEVTLFIKVEADDNSLGFDKVQFTLPDNYYPVDTEEWTILKNGVLVSNENYNINISGYVSTIHFNNPYEGSINIELKLKMFTPPVQDISTGGANINGNVDREGVNVPVPFTEGDADFNPGNYDNLNIQTGKLCEQILSEVYPYIVPGNKEEFFTLYFKPFINASNLGYNKFVINTGKNFHSHSINSFNVDGSSDFINTFNINPQPTEYYSNITQDSEGNTIITIISGLKFNIQHHNKVVKLGFNMTSKDIVSTGEQILISAYNTLIPGRIAVISGDADILVNSERLDIKIQKPATNVNAEIIPSKVIAQNKTDLTLYVKPDINAAENSGVNYIEVELGQNFKLSCATSEIRIWDQVTSPSSGRELLHSNTNTPLASYVWVESDPAKTSFTLKLGDTLLSTNTYKIIFKAEVPENMQNATDFVVKADNYVSTSVIVAEASNCDFDADNDNKLSVTTGNLIDTSYSEIYVQEVVNKVNSVAYGSTSNNIVLSALPSFSSENNFGFNRLLLEIPSNFSNPDFNSSQVKIGEITFTKTSSAPGETECRIIHNPIAGNTGGTIEIQFGKTIDITWPFNQKNTFFDFKIDAPSQEGEFLFKLFCKNTNISSDMKQKFYEGVTGITIHQTEIMKVNVVKTPAKSFIAEISPTNLKPSISNQKFILSSLITFDAQNSGIKSFKIDYPDTYSNVTFSQLLGASLLINGVNCAITTSPAPIGNVVYFKNYDSEKYFTLTLGTLLKQDATSQKNIQITFYASNTTVPDSPNGKSFNITALSDALNPLSIIATEGNVPGNPSSDNLLKVISANSVNSMRGEFKIVGSSGFSGENKNLIMYNSILNKVDYFTSLNFISGNRGVNQLGFVFDTRFLPGGTNPIVNGTLKIWEGETEILYENPQWSGNTYYITLKTIITENIILKIQFDMDGPNNISAVDEEVPLQIFADYHFAAFNVIDDGYNFRVDATSANITSLCQTDSIYYTCVKTPAQKAFAEIHPISTFINKTENYELTILPEITAANSGVDVIRLNIPATFSNIVFSSLKIRGAQITEGVDFARSQSGNTITLSLINDVITSVDNQKIIVNYQATAQSQHIYSTNEVSIYVGNSLSAKEIPVIGGNANASISTDMIDIEIRALASKALGYITPDFMVIDSTNNIFTLNLDLDFNTRDLGAKYINIDIPVEFTNLDFDSSTMKINNNTFNIIRSAFPGANDVLLNYNETTNKVLLTFGTNIKQQSNIEFTFKMDAPHNPLNKSFKLSIINTANNVNQNILEKYTGSFNVSTEKASIDNIAIQSYLEADSQGNWKVNIKIPFNVLMDTDYPGPDIYLNGTKVTVLKYNNIPYPSYSDPVRGVVEGIAYIPYDKLKGNNKDILTMSKLKDTRGNLITPEPVFINSGYGIALSIFLNPVDRKNLTVVARISEPLKDGHTLIFEAREFGGTSKRLFTMKNTADIYSAVYNIDKDGTPLITASIYDNFSQTNEEILKMISKEVKSLRLSPEKPKEIAFSGMKMNFLKNTVGIESIGYISDFDYISENPNIEVTKSFDFSVNSQLRKSVVLTKEKSEKNELLYTIKDGKLLFVCNLNDGKYNLSENAKYVIAKDKKAPNIKEFKVEENILSYFVEDEESRVKSITATINGKKYNAVAGRGNVKLSQGIHNIEFEAEDMAGNIANHKVTVRINKAPIISGFSVYPVPADKFVNFKINTTASSENKLKILDNSGKLIYSYRWTGSGGNDFITWDLVDRKGRNVANGVYFYKIESQDSSGKEEKTGKLAVLK